MLIIFIKEYRKKFHEQTKKFQYVYCIRSTSLSNLCIIEPNGEYMELEFISSQTFWPKKKSWKQAIQAIYYNSE